MNPHVIDTRAPAPRKVGGGLDDPEPTTTSRPRRRRTDPNRTPTTGTHRTSTQPPAGHRTPAATAEADTRTGHDDRTPTGHAQPAPPATRPAGPAPTTGAVTGAAAEEVTAVRAALAALVPVGESVSTLRLVQMVAAKLSGHGIGCAAAWHPPRGSLTLDDARARCRAVLDAFDPVERHALLALVTHDVRAATR